MVSTLNVISDSCIEKSWSIGCVIQQERVTNTTAKTASKLGSIGGQNDTGPWPMLEEPNWSVDTNLLRFAVAWWSSTMIRASPWLIS